MIACNDDFMDRYPKDALTDQSFWNSPEDLENYANSFYPSLATPTIFTNDFSWLVMWDNQSDNKGTGTPQPYLFGQEVPEATSSYWDANAWSNIRAANYFLTHYSKAKGDASKIASSVGEIKFFRAWEYFKKIKRFGDVPWINKDLATNDEEYLYKARDSRKLVMDSVLADLDFAIANLNEPSNVPIGRLHKYAALAFKSRVCLYEASFRKYHALGDEQKFFTEAKNAANAVMSSNLYSLYTQGEPQLDYWNLFNELDKTKNPESILCMVYSSNILTTSTVNYMEANGYNGFTKDLAESYLCIDGKPISVSPLYLGDDSLEMEMTNRDPRMKQTIDNKSIPYKIQTDGTITYNVIPRVSITSPTGYHQIKYHSPIPSEYELGLCTIDGFIFRYAEVLLNYA